MKLHLFSTRSSICNIKKVFSSFQIKLIVCFLLCSVIPFLIVGIVGYYTSFKIAEDKITESTSLSNKQLVQQLNDRFTQMENVSDSVQNYLYILATKPQDPLSEYLDYFSYARNNISSLNTNFQLFQICAFLQPDSFISNEGLMFYKLENLEKFKINAEELTNIGISSKWFFRSNLDFPSVLSHGELNIDCILCFQSLSINDSLMYAFFTSIKSRDLAEQLQASFIDTPISSYLLTPEGNVAVHTTNTEIGSKVKKETFEILMKHVNKDTFEYGPNRYFVNSLDNGFYLVTEIPTDYITANIQGVVKVTFTVLLFMIPIVIGVTIFISNNLTKKLRRLTKVVRSTNLSGNSITTKDLGHRFKLNSEYGDEIDNLASTYQTMVQTIDSNLNDILKLTIQEEKLNYQLLQSQINPHFLYNILSSIQTCQTVGKISIANQMITDLSRFYRMLLRKSNDLITIQDELEISRLYLEMEQLCRDGSFTWNVQLEDGIENFMICKFTLQAFLENCILHGIGQGKKSIHIAINVYYGTDTIIITIKDNGIGINEAQLNGLKDSLKNKIVDYSKNFGICNVNARISSPLFGSGNVQIDSTLLEGTTVTIEFQQILDEIEE